MISMMIIKARENGFVFFFKRWLVWGGKIITRTKYVYALNVLFAEAENDPEIEMVIVTRKREEVILRGMRNGKRIQGELEFERLLLPIMNKLKADHPIEIIRFDGNH